MWMKYKALVHTIHTILKDVADKNLSFYFTETQYYDFPNYTSATVPGIRQTHTWEPEDNHIRAWFDTSIPKIIKPLQREVFIQEEDQFIKTAHVEDLCTISDILKLCKMKPSVYIETYSIAFPIGTGTFFITLLKNTNQFYIEGEELEEAPVLQEFVQKYNITDIEDRSFYNIVAFS